MIADPIAQGAFNEWAHSGYNPFYLRFPQESESACDFQPSCKGYAPALPFIDTDQGNPLLQSQQNHCCLTLIKGR